MDAKVFLRRVACMMLSAMLLSVPVMAQGVGAIGGTVTDASGGVLPGAVVVLANPGVIGGSQQVVADSRGIYQFVRLVPGTYSVKAELAGFKTTTQQNIIVNADATARADLKLEVGSLEEGITVTGEAPLLDTTTAMKQTVMPRDLIDSLPGRTDIWAVGRMVPALISAKIDVGGTESYQSSGQSVHGSIGIEGQTMVDGMSVGHAGGESAMAFYPDPNMYQEINYQTSNASAEQTMGGVVVNMIPRTGTNTFHGGQVFSGTRSGMGWNNISPDLRTALLAGVPARVLAADPNLVPATTVLKLWDSGVFFSGPIVLNKLWYAATGKYGQQEQKRLGSYDVSGKQSLDLNQGRAFSVRFSWQAQRNTQVHLLFERNEKLQIHRNTTTDYLDSNATFRQFLPQNLYQPKMTRILSSRMLLDVSGSHAIVNEKYGEQFGMTAGTIPKFDSVLRTYADAYENYQNRPNQLRTNAAASVSYSAGGHDVKVGYQFMRVRYQLNSYGLSHFPSGLRAVYRSGVPNSVNTFNTPTNAITFYRENALFMQDKWVITRKLTLNLGMRVDSFYGWTPDACQPATVFVAEGRCFAGIKGVPNFKMAVPRMAAVYDMFGDGKTALKFAVNQYYIPGGTGYTNRINPIAVVSDTRSWTVCTAGQTSGCDLNRDLAPQLNELGPSTGFNFGNTNRYSPDVTWPYSFEWNVEVQRQLPANMAVNIGYYHRGQRRLLAPRNVAVPADSYIPMTVKEVSTDRTVTVYNQAPALRGRFDTLWDNAPELNTDFDGVDISINKRMSHGLALFGGVSFGKNIGDIFGASDLNNPNFTFRRGDSGQVVPFTWKLSGTYALPYSFMLSFSQQYVQGFAENTTVLVDSATVALTQVSQSIVIEPRGTTRLPGTNELDLGLRRTMRFGGVQYEPTLDLYNVLNASTITSRSTQLGPTYLRPQGIQRGRLLRLGLQVKF